MKMPAVYLQMASDGRQARVLDINSTNVSHTKIAFVVWIDACKHGQQKRLSSTAMQLLKLLTHLKGEAFGNSLMIVDCSPVW